MAVFIEAHNVITSLGFSTIENYKQIMQGATGIKLVNDPSLWNDPFPVSQVDSLKLSQIIKEPAYTRFDRLMLASAKLAVEQTKVDVAAADTLFILSTTKGNVELLAGNVDERQYLWHSTKLLAQYFKNPNTPQVVSNACISGSMAIIIGQRLIEAGLYNHVVVVGADSLSKFIVSGFQSFHSLSPEPCKPFDINRDGLSLGEGAGTIILTNNESLITEPKIEVSGGGISNDANHISGPSRTGEGLLLAIKGALKNGVEPEYISAHGTATPYNDDMESKAIFRAGLSHVPVSSFKGYFGHTLGAAGVIEALIAIEAMRNRKLIKTLGLQTQGVAENITVVTDNQDKTYHHLLKLVSGFGGCNAAVLFTKHD